MKMKGIILVGGTFIGYWVKRRLTMEFQCSPIILDLPRKNTINRYYKTKNFYQSMFNNLNDTYLLYFEVLARAKLMNTQMLLLPNVFGPMELERSIISTILTKVRNQEDLILPNTKRDFLYVESVIEQEYPKELNRYFQYDLNHWRKETSTVDMTGSAYSLEVERRVTVLTREKG
jgi:hypothetical protein